MLFFELFSGVFLCKNVLDPLNNVGALFDNIADSFDLVRHSVGNGQIEQFNSTFRLDNEKSHRCNGYTRARAAAEVIVVCHQFFL